MSTVNVFRWGFAFLSCGLGLAAAAEGMDPVPATQVPGSSVAATVVVDDGDAAVQVTPKGELTHTKEPTHGGTVRYVNGDRAGDGATTLTVTPTLSAGRYAIWVRYLYIAGNFFAIAERATVSVATKQGPIVVPLALREAGGQWLLLGVFDLTGSGPALSMTNDKVQGIIGFDAAVFVPMPKTAALKLAPRVLPDDGPGFATVIRRAAECAIGPTDLPSTDVLVQERLAARDMQARNAWDGLIRTKERTRLWGDTLQTSSWMLTMDAERISLMASAWAGATDLYGTGMRGNPQLLADTLAALDTFLAERWTPTTKWDVNWFDFEIAVPRHILAALCCLGPHATEALKSKVFASMAHFTEDPLKYYDKGADSTGANRIWMVQNHLRRAALAGDAKAMEHCRDGLTEVFQFVDRDPGNLPKSRDGWWSDGTFVQHEHLPYIGAYGVLMIPELIESMMLIEGTPWAVTTPERKHLAGWVDSHLLPVAFEGELFSRTTGRTTGSSGIETSHEWLAIALCEMRPLLEKDQAALVTSRLRRWMDKGGLGGPIERATFAQFMHLHAIAGDKQITAAGPYCASRTQAAGDMIVHHRPTWAASVAMSSPRTVSHEALWGANYRGWNQGEGVLQVWAGDPCRYRQGYWALVDPYRLPGITTNTWMLPDHDAGGMSPKLFGTQDFVGGVSLDDLASVAAMRVGTSWSSLDARKGWFFLPDSVVCLGSGITATDGRATETIVESARIEDLGQALTIDGKPVPSGDWKSDKTSAHSVHLAGTVPERSIGWWFPQSPKGLSGERVIRRGAWVNANAKESAASIERPWFHLAIAHGVDPKDANYQYVVLPGISAAKLAAFTAKPSIDIISYTSKVHCVQDRGNGLTAAIFWEAGQAGPITVDQPCIVLIHEKPGNVAIAVADPTQKLDQVTVSVALAAAKQDSVDAGMTVTIGTPLRVSVSLRQALGRARTARFTR